MTSIIATRPICFRVTALSPAKKRRLLIILLLLAAASVYTADPPPPPLYDGGPVLPIAPISPVNTDPARCQMVQHCDSWGNCYWLQECH
jgi:hypothetical protein